MPANQNTGGGFNLGKDCVFLVVGPNNVNLTINNVTGLSIKQMTAPVTVDRLDGIQMNVAIPKGWEVNMEFDRGDANVDEFIESIEDDWYETGFIGTGQIYQYITELDGSLTTFIYDNGAFTFSDAGSWKGDASVKCKLDAKCNRRQSL
jgi:hypothetical protein